MSNEIKKPSGLKIKINVEGDGEKPTAGQTVVAHYRGTLENGTKFDSSLIIPCSMFKFSAIIFSIMKISSVYI